MPFGHTSGSFGDSFLKALMLAQAWPQCLHSVGQPLSSLSFLRALPIPMLRQVSLGPLKQAFYRGETQLRPTRASLEKGLSKPGPKGYLGIFGGTFSIFREPLWLPFMYLGVLLDQQSLIFEVCFSVPTKTGARVGGCHDVKAVVVFLVSKVSLVLLRRRSSQRPIIQILSALQSCLTSM